MASWTKRTHNQNYYPDSENPGMRDPGFCQTLLVSTSGHKDSGFVGYLVDQNAKPYATVVDGDKLFPTRSKAHTGTVNEWHRRYRERHPL